MRFVIATIKHETNTFSPIRTPLASFAIGRPDGLPAAGSRAIEAFRGTNTPLCAFIDLAEEEKAEIVLPVAAEAAPSGPVTDEAFDTMAAAVCDSIRTGCDAVFLDLHGAMVDIPYVSLSALIVADGDILQAERLRDAMLEMAWERRADFVFSVEPLAGSIARAKRLEGDPIVLVDHGDNVFSGGTQDVMETVAEALKQGLSNMAVGPIWDPDSVTRMVKAGVGSNVSLQLGGKTDMPALGFKSKPLELRGVVRRITDGHYKVTCPMDTGITLNHGTSAVLEMDDVDILVCSERMEAYDLGVFRHAGIEPTTKRYLLIKSREHFRAGFEPIAQHIVLLSGPGVTSSDYSLFRFNKIHRPIYPLDRDIQFHHLRSQ